MTITPAQIKVARGILGWTQVELARRSNVPNSVIALFETHKRLPAREVLADLKKTLESFGVRFVEGESYVRLLRNDIIATTAV
jgi:ribosome-binding protein aMBF1 (putative translation factor)